MTARCPDGHVSETADYCDQCGAPIVPGTGTSQPTEVLPVVEELDTSPSTLRQPCPVCAAPRSGDDRYCESCGHDFLAPPPASATWEAIATADRAQFDRLAVTGVSFPDDYSERRFALSGAETTIGRSRGDPGETALGIDLAQAPVDPGISRQHAALARQGDGTYVLRDLGSTNGTTLNDNPAPIAPHTAVPISDGDRIRLGAWTTITLRRR
jgi:hypothetical protein